MSVIENLLALDTSGPQQIKSSSKQSENFIVSLIDSLKESPKELNKLLKDLKIKPGDLKNITDKTSDIDNILKKLNIKETVPQKTGDSNKNPKQTVKENPDKEISLLSELIAKFEDQTKSKNRIGNKDKKDSENSLNGNIETISGFFQTKTGFINPKSQNKNLKHLDKQITAVTKQIIQSSKILDNMKLDGKEITQFKNITSLKELIDFADRHNMNLSKIVIQYGETEQKTSKIYPKPKIAKNINFQKPAALKFSDKSLNTKNRPENIKSKLSELIIQKQPSKQNENTRALNPETVQHIPEGASKKEKHGSADHTEYKNSFIAPDNKISDLKQNILKAKSSIKHFASNLKEAVENYKPPVSKVTMQMHPQELGKVDVTIVHRGDSLQIQINSNNTAVSFLHSQQQELKQNLINMGFTDVNMSFNSNQQQGSRQYKQNQKLLNGSNEENEELIIEIPYQYA